MQEAANRAARRHASGERGGFEHDDPALEEHEGHWTYTSHKSCAQRKSRSSASTSRGARRWSQRCGARLFSRSLNAISAPHRSCRAGRCPTRLGPRCVGVLGVDPRAAVRFREPTRRPSNKTSSTQGSSVARGRVRIARDREPNRCASRSRLERWSALVRRLRRSGSVLTLCGRVWLFTCARAEAAIQKAALCAAKFGCTERVGFEMRVKPVTGASSAFDAR